jgi:hypothetical protein
MACMLSRTKCFAGASTARPAQPTRAVRMVVRASAQKQQMPAFVKPAIATAGQGHWQGMAAAGSPSGAESSKDPLIP